MVKLSFSSSLDKLGLSKKFITSKTTTQKYLAAMILQDTTPYVPRYYGDLVKSAYYGFNDTHGYVVWNTFYARTLYYGVHLDFTTAIHSKATSFWFLHAKAEYNKKWTNYSSMVFALQFLHK